MARTAKAFDSPDLRKTRQAKIDQNMIIQRLSRFIAGEVEMSAAAVSAALGLLRKTMPDLSSAEIKSDVTHRYVARVPEKQPDAGKWQEQHAPQLTQH